MKQVKTDIVVIGTGVAGFAAATAASRNQKRVLLIERAEAIGGNAIQSNVGTICGAYYRTDSDEIKKVDHPMVSFVIESLKLQPRTLTNGLIVNPFDVKLFNQFIEKELDNSKLIDLWLLTKIKKVTPEKDTLKTIVVDGLPVETTDAGAAAIDKLTAENKALKDASVSVQSTHDAAIQTQKDASDTAIATKDTELAAKDVELASKDTEIKELKEKVLDGAALDALVEKRATLVAKASGLVKDADFSGKTDLEIMTIAVDAVNEEGFAKDKSPAYIEAAFDMAKVPEGDEVREALKSQDKKTTTKDNGYSDYVQSLTDAYKGEAA